jgi:orotate phosphoribosyltransferase
MTNLEEHYSAAMRQVIALHLLREGAVQIGIEKPFQLASGNYSPIYINCRTLISSQAFVDLFSSYARTLAHNHDLEFDVIAGGETAGIPFAAFLARSLGKPMIYVRKAPKSHGTHGTVEGVVRMGARVLLVEDLITDAASKVGFIASLRSLDVIVKDVLVILDRLQGGRESLKQHSIRLHSMIDIHDLLTVARSTGSLSSNDNEELALYLASPSAWHLSRHLEFKEI